MIDNEIKLPNFKQTVNVDKVNDFSFRELKALDRLLDGKATKQDYKILGLNVPIKR